MTAKNIKSVALPYVIKQTGYSGDLNDIRESGFYPILTGATNLPETVLPHLAIGCYLIDLFWNLHTHNINY